ncbi:MAG: carbohydrate kinase family protein [Candidatus Limnocylindrales bacterium]
MIIVAGEALIDLIVGPDGRVEAVPGGGPFNVARTMARLGASVGFLGRLSSDAFGRMLRDRLVADGVGLELVVETTDPTTLAVAALDAGGGATYQFYTAGTSAAGLRPIDLPDVGRPVALHVGTLGLVLEPLADAIETLVARVPADVLVMVDINARPVAITDRAGWVARLDRVLARADVVSGSLDDLAIIHPDRAPEAAAADVLALGPRVVLLTDGPRHARIVTRRGTTALPPPRVEVVDTVGAGDAFGGSFLASWFEIGAGAGAGGDGPTDDLDDDAALVAATERALVVASLTTTRRGADPPTAAELAAGTPSNR